MEWKSRIRKPPGESANIEREGKYAIAGTILLISLWVKAGETNNKFFLCLFESCSNNIIINFYVDK